jgi:hypothetical protein
MPTHTRSVAAANIYDLSAADRASHRRQLLIDFQQKAEEYLNALCLEVGLAIDQRESKVLQEALRQDFIEVHNAALEDRISVPANKSEINKLLE